ncbi:unnamed protein product, partial [Choristocarpus tenellus]
RSLRLNNNYLSSLPDGLLKLTSLHTLSLRHNIFSALPYRFGDLRCLEKLDLGENTLKTLPATMLLLTNLKYLRLEGNNMPHLALPPLLRTSDSKDDHSNWKRQWLKEKKKEVWVNQLTGEMIEADPTKLERNDGGLPPASEDLEEGTYWYNQNRSRLATKGIFEWEPVLDASTGKVHYTNNVSRMPDCMDQLGAMTSLVTLKLNQNKLRAMYLSLAATVSICQCDHMELLEVNDNYLEYLPMAFGNMRSLRTVRLNMNNLSELPPSTQQLTALQELSLNNNYFKAFPDFVMKLTNLQKLMLGNNQLTKLPYSAGQLEGQMRMILYNNPLADPPGHLLLKGMGTVLWECRQLYWAQMRGPPPEVQVHGYGIQEEKLELEPAFNNKLAAQISVAAKSLEFNFIMEGLTYFPMGLFDEKVGPDLKYLRLDSNNFGGATIPFQHKWQDLEKVHHEV